MEALEKQFKYPSVLDNPPSEETMREMAIFFSKTSVPRLLKELEENENNQNHN